MTTTTTRHDDRLSLGDRLHMRRSRGATTGILLVLLGVWGGLVPFWGPMFGYAFTPDLAWHFTYGRLWMEILPAVATILGGLWLLGSANRVSGWLGAWLGAAGGAWFVIGQQVSRLWNGGTPQAGVPTAASSLGWTVQQIGFFSGLGVVIVFLAAAALGRMSVVGVADVRHLRDGRAAATEEPAAEERIPAQRNSERDPEAEPPKVEH